MIEMAVELSGGTILTLSLMDRTQLPWEWRWEREEGREPATPPCLLLLLSVSFLHGLLADFPVVADENPVC